MNGKTIEQLNTINVYANEANEYLQRLSSLLGTNHAAEIARAANLCDEIAKEARGKIQRAHAAVKHESAIANLKQVEKDYASAMHALTFARICEEFSENINLTFADDEGSAHDISPMVRIHFPISERFCHLDVFTPNATFTDHDKEKFNGFSAIVETIDGSDILCDFVDVFYFDDLIESISNFLQDNWREF